MPTSLRSPAHQLLLARLKQVRKAAGLKQSQVAERLNVPQSYIAKVEGGERRLDVIEFIHLIQAIGVDPAGIIADIAGTLVAQTRASIEPMGTCDTAE